MLIISGIWTKKMAVHKNDFDVVNRRNNGLQRGIKIIVEAFWQRLIFDLEIVKYFNFSEQLQNIRPLLFKCSGVLWRTSQNTKDAILIQWHANQWPGILKFSQFFTTHSLICLGWLTSRQSNWLTLVPWLPYGCINIYIHPQSNRSNTVVLRASYILPNLKQFLW